MRRLSPPASRTRMLALMRSVATASLTLATTIAHSSGPCDPATFAPAGHRFLEDCRGLSAFAIDGEQRQGLQALRYLPIGDGADRFVTLGGELRFRWEHLDPQRFGLGGGKAFSATEERLAAHADVNFENFRLFTQLNASAESGWPVARPGDHSAVDVAQGFVQWQLSSRDPNGGSFIRLGRQEIALAPNRLIGVNEATNLRRTFDGALAQVSLHGTTATAFLTRRVINRPGSFDDRSNNDERFSGLNLHAPLLANFQSTFLSLQSADAFVFRRDRDIATFQNANGSEVRDTYGVRLAGDVATLAYLLQIDWQRGHVGTQAISARAATLDLTWRPEGFQWNPLVSTSLGWAGGDRHPNDGTIGTFDTLYPNLAYGTDAGYFFPGNSRDASIAVTVQPLPRSSVQAGVFGYWRLSKYDAIYQPPGLILIRGDGTGSNQVAVLPFLKLAYRLDRYSEISASVVRLSAGPAITSQGGHSSSYGLVQWQFRF